MPWTSFLMLTKELMTLWDKQYSKSRLKNWFHFNKIQSSTQILLKHEKNRLLLKILIHVSVSFFAYKYKGIFGF